MEKLEKVKDYINNSRSGQTPITDIDEPLRLDSLSFIRTVAFLANDREIGRKDPKNWRQILEVFFG